MKKNEIQGLFRGFEAAVIEIEGVECWSARQLQELLGYTKWQNFSNILERAKESCQGAGEAVSDHFTDVSKVIEVSKGVQRSVDDVLLTRYACYLVAQNGDFRKEPIAFAQTYFAVQARRDAKPVQRNESKSPKGALMLRSIKLKNFKSYRQAELPLAPLTVLIGANASGKSNAIEAMRFLSWLAQGQKLSSIRYAIQNGDQLMRGKVDDLAYRREDSFEIGCEVDASEYTRLDLGILIREGDLHVHQESIVSELRTVPLYRLEQPSSGQSTDVIVQYDNFARGGVKPRVTCSDQGAVFTQLTSPASFGANHKESQKKIPAVARGFEAALGSMLFLDPVPAKMRGYSFPSEKQIRGDGENLSGALYHLWGGDETPLARLDASHRSNREDILRFIQSLPEQDISSVDFLKEPRGGVMVQLTETFGGKRMSYEASLLSDGTLRVLAIAAAMLSATNGSLVVIEEIDNGVHPSRASHLLEQIQAIAKRRNLRVLLSTHNPAMLDALPDPAIPHVVFCYRDPSDGSSRLVRLEDVADYPELIAQGTLGSLVTTGTLERFVKQAVQPEEKQAKAMAWLESIRTVSHE